jgi:hypothetical protein
MAQLEGKIEEASGALLPGPDLTSLS